MSAFDRAGAEETGKPHLVQNLADGPRFALQLEHAGIPGGAAENWLRAGCGPRAQVWLSVATRPAVGGAVWDEVRRCPVPRFPPPFLMSSSLAQLRAFGRGVGSIKGALALPLSRLS